MGPGGFGVYAMNKTGVWRKMSSAARHLLKPVLACNSFITTDTGASITALVSTFHIFIYLCEHVLLGPQNLR